MPTCRAEFPQIIFFSTMKIIFRRRKNVARLDMNLKCDSNEFLVEIFIKYNIYIQNFILYSFSCLYGSSIRSTPLNICCFISRALTLIKCPTCVAFLGPKSERQVNRSYEQFLFLTCGVRQADCAISVRAWWQQSQLANALLAWTPLFTSLKLVWPISALFLLEI